MSDTNPVEGGFPEALVDLLSRNTGKELPDINVFHTSIDDSDYSMSDWVEALVCFDDWLTTQKVTERPIGIMIGYIKCCTMGNATKVSLPSLQSIVIKSLTEFGFDGETESQI